MVGYIDGKNLFQMEVLFGIRIQEWQDEIIVGSVYVNRNIIIGFSVICIEGFVKGFNIIVQIGLCNFLDWNYIDCIFIIYFQGFFWVKCGFVQC